MSKRFNFYILVVLLLLFSVAIGSYLLRGQRTFRSKAAPDTSLSFNQTNSVIHTNDTFTVEVVVNTGTNEIVGGDFEITYDRTKFLAQSVMAGPFLPNAQIPNNVSLGTTDGHLVFSIIQQPGNPAPRGTGVIANIQFTALAVGNSVLTYQNSTVIAAVNEGYQNVLVNKSPITISVADPTPILTPTPTPTFTPTPTPTPIVAQLIGDIGGGLQGEPDCKVNLLDYVLLFESFLKTPGELGYNSRANLTGDTAGVVNLLDYVLLFEHFNERCPT